MPRDFRPRRTSCVVPGCWTPAPFFGREVTEDGAMLGCEWCSLGITILRTPGFYIFIFFLANIVAAVSLVTRLFRVGSCVLFFRHQLERRNREGGRDGEGGRVGGWEGRTDGREGEGGREVWMERERETTTRRG